MKRYYNLLTLGYCPARYTIDHMEWVIFALITCQLIMRHTFFFVNLFVFIITSICHIDVAIDEKCCSVDKYCLIESKYNRINLKKIIGGENFFVPSGILLCIEFSFIKFRYDIHGWKLNFFLLTCGCITRFPDRTL